MPMDRLKSVHAQIANHCVEVSDLFKPGARVTILVRNPGLGDGDLVVTDDSFDHAISALEKLKAKDAIKLSATEAAGLPQVGQEATERPHQPTAQAEKEKP